MSTSHATDVNVSTQRISQLTSPDAVAAFFTELGYDTERRSELSPEAIGLSGDAAAAIQRIEVLCEDVEGFLRVAFVKLRSLTAKSRNDLTRVLGRTNIEHLLVLASDFATIEFVLIHKQRRDSRAPGRAASIQPIPLMIALDRKAPSTKELRAIRRFTWTKRDGLEQYDKLRSVFEAAAFTEEYFCNRALFADHFLMTRLRDDAAWQENPAAAFQGVRDLMRDPAKRWLEKGEQVVRDELFEPLFTLLGFRAKAAKPAKDGRNNPDYHLTGPNGAKTVAFTYAWDRWLDGPDFQLDADTPNENPGACVVTALEEGKADWIIVTNGRQWRLYSRAAHSRATNFYEVDLAEALVASGDTDPNESFRYWWLFLRAEAFAPTEDDAERCWLDAIAEGSRDYAKDLGKRLKDRVFVTIFPHLAQGFLHDRKQRLGLKRKPTDDELRDIYEATLTLLYRLLFLLYAEARDLLPIREGPYREASLRKIKEEIADKGGIAESEVADRLRKAFSAKEHALYDRLGRLCRAMDKGDASLNVPIYNGGLFITDPAEGEDRSREQRIARFLAEHKVPDQHLALAIDRLARDPDDRTHSLVSIDYKSLAVRHLGSIYEGLLEFKLKVADEDLATKTEKKKEKYIPLRDARPTRGRAPAAVVRKGDVYLSNDKAERKASGSYYTPDPIVEYIVEHTVGPVLDEKLEALRPELRKVRKTFDNELQKLRVPPVPKAIREGRYSEREFAAEKTYAAHKDLVERLFDFRTLDPAMGSGHFLVDAVDFITDRMLAFLNQFPVNPVTFMLNLTRHNIEKAIDEQGVSFDTSKLTEVNLLKRHVLKRCIYGVDLNPMAVELAKVSLWLDAFTVGAPLSFLDHHLRCGNAIVGATWDDLNAAIEDRPMLRINKQPLVEAIRQVVDVNRRSDATAAEVKQSASMYRSIRERLSGFGIVFDLLIAPHFGHADARGLVTEGDSLDLNGRESFLASLHSDEERELVRLVDATAADPNLRFFHWEIEFPEVFFGFQDADQRQLRHKDRISPGSAGFDAIVGNPPYVRQETIKPLKNYLKASFKTYNAANDLYVYFQEREIDLLQSHRRMGMIVSNKWMRAGYGERIRQYLKHVGQPIDLIDFGHTPIFPDADTFPCILVAARRQSKVDEVGADDSFTACPIPRDDWSPQMNLGAYCHSKQYNLPTNLMRAEVWSLEDPRIQALLEKIRNVGVPLRDLLGCRVSRGPGTGLNEAFNIDLETKNKIVSQDPKAETVLRPLLRGRDLDRWAIRDPTMYLILAFRGFDEKKFSSVLRHLSTFREKLEPRPDNWDERRQGKWPGRKPGTYEWYELQDSMDEQSLAAMCGPKIVFQEMAWFTRFAFDPAGLAVANTAYFIPVENPLVEAVLNSPLAWWYMWRTAQHGKDEVLRLIKAYLEDFPLPATNARALEMATMVQTLRSHTRDLHDCEQEAITAFELQFDFKGAEAVVDWLALEEDAFVARASVLLQASSTTSGELLRFQREHRARQIEHLQSRLAIETQLATLVEDAYQLTPEERRLLHETRPPRDPIDVLQSRVLGKSSGENEAFTVEEQARST